jgi:hypothetical protein
MVKKGWVDKAAEDGNWGAAKARAADALRKSGTRIRRTRKFKDESEAFGRFGGLEPDTPEPADASEDAVQEYKDNISAGDEDCDVLPSDQEEKALATSGPDGKPVEMMPRQRRKAELAARAEAERQRILAQQARRKIVKAAEAARLGAELERRERVYTLDEILENKDLLDLYAVSEEEFWARFERQGDDRPNWAGVSEFKPPGPPPDPPPVAERIWTRGSSSDWWHFKNRGVLSALNRPDGRHLRFGHAPKPIPVANPYFGCTRQKPGPKPKPDKLSPAERARRYRAKKKKVTTKNADGVAKSKESKDAAL